jgi:hypothetical protein
LSGNGFTVIAVALDDSPDDVRPFVEGITIPVLIDAEHLLTELYAISNVPTVIWIDEQDRIVRPNGVAFSSDMFKEFTGVEAGPHLDTVRNWVRTGAVPITPEDARQAVGDLSDDEIRARLHFRVAAHARRNGDDATAQQHFAEAGRLAPSDFTIRRAAMPLTGGNPFGPEFMELYSEWQEAGSPYHGLPGATTS